MSDSLEDLVYVKRQHRCRPPTKPRLGWRFHCGCGTTFQFVQTRFGLQWLPVSDTVAAGAHAKRRSGKRGVPGIAT